MKVYGIKTCASSKKALEFFNNNNIEYEFIKIDNNIPKEHVEYWLNFVSPETLFNTRSKSYKDLELKGKDLSKKTQVKKLWEENGVLKRPIIEHGLNGEEKLCVGFDEEDYKELFLAY
jgi:arsenate reductase (glutaredoxin)